MGEKTVAPRIAVVIVNFNSGPLLMRCLRALELQERRADSVIVVDNDSQDDLPGDVEGFDWVRLITTLSSHLLLPLVGLSSSQKTLAFSVKLPD
jgi:hypothetical protein